MSSPPPETETHEVVLSREERWVVHHVVAIRVDDALDAEETPPAWAIDVFETIESDDEPETFTHRQIRRLADLLADYLDSEETPQQDLVHGSAVLERLEDVTGARA
ncbi:MULTISPECIES: hypothetical protein [Natrialba]|uniref:Uncharacterized protein n=1 Tax=Natrialba swarupiae TaxID=2448032 RepID=A0A5D5AQP1_9EURY|nr:MULTISPECIES: hypothetical protein [Natrialba]MCW8173097.1 hypothetical protein [Natrialba swarupiae]MWV40887.1 hypothetical protein [Natrialba sp. INN-245]TYT63323.1 hypothetical protein FYC77_04435 [Natrialba swarupiae]